MLHFHTWRHVYERAPAENRGVQGRKFVVAGRYYFAKPAPENFRMLFQPFGRADKDHALFADSLLDVGINRFAIELRLHSGEELAFLLRNTEPLEGALYVVGNFVPRAFGTLGIRKIIADFAEIDRLEVFARPVRRERFALEGLQRFQPKFADPIWILLHIGNVIHHALIQADAGVEAVIDLVMEVTNVAIDIDG